MSDNNNKKMVLCGTMRGHNDWVTGIATPIVNSNMIVSSSRDTLVIVWRLIKQRPLFGADPASCSYGIPIRWLHGHSHFVQDVVLSSCGQFALSASSDGDLRLWNLKTGATTRRFVGHTKAVLSVTFSNDRWIVSATSDRTIKLWNTLGECKYTIPEGGTHSKSVSCVQFIPSPHAPTIVSASASASASRDCTLKVWNLSNGKLRKTLTGHSRCVKTVAVSKDGTMCASGGNDGLILLWDLADLGDWKQHQPLDVGTLIHALRFSPSRHWLCAATQDSVMIWDLVSMTVIQELKIDVPTDSTPTHKKRRRKKIRHYCTSLSWSFDGSTLYTGYTDSDIRVWEFESPS